MSSLRTGNSALTDVLVHFQKQHHSVHGAPHHWCHAAVLYPGMSRILISFCVLDELTHARIQLPWSTSPILQLSTAQACLAGCLLDTACRYLELTLLSVAPCPHSVRFYMPRKNSVLFYLHCYNFCLSEGIKPPNVSSTVSFVVPLCSVLFLPLSAIDSSLPSQ